MAAVLNGLLRVAIVPLFITPLFNEVLDKRDASALPRVLLIAAAVAIGGSLALWAQDALLGRAAANVTADWRARLYRALLSSPPGALPGSSGGLASRLQNDLREVETFIRFGLGTLIAESVTLLLILILLLRTDALAAGALFLLALPAVLALKWLGGRLQRVAERSMASSEEVGAHLQEGLKHHEVARAFGARDFLLARFTPPNEGLRRTMSQRAWVAGLQAPLTQVLIFTALGVLVVLLVMSVNRGDTSVGAVIAFLTLVALAATPTQLLPHGYAMLKQARAGADRLRALTDQPLTNAEAKLASTGELAAAGASAVTFAWAGEPPAGAPLMVLKGVGFSYRDGQPVLSSVDLELPRRGLVVVSGPSGSGKTTLLRLLLRFSEPSEGNVSLDGVPLPQVPETELRQRVSYVPQEHGLLSGELREVLGMGRTLTDAQLWAATEAVGLAEVVRSLPGELAAKLGEDGGGLSGGQKQRLAIARSLLGDPSALLLDEPTSNLDDEAERGIVELMKRLAAQRLVLAVTHRPALADAADHLLESQPEENQPEENQAVGGRP